jgi:hypothetical protein
LTDQPFDMPLSLPQYTYSGWWQGGFIELSANFLWKSPYDWPRVTAKSDLPGSTPVNHPTDVTG